MLPVDIIGHWFHELLPDIPLGVSATGFFHVATLLSTQTLALDTLLRLTDEPVQVRCLFCLGLGLSQVRIWSVLKRGGRIFLLLRGCYTQIDLLASSVVDRSQLEWATLIMRRTDVLDREHFVIGGSPPFAVVKGLKAVTHCLVKEKKSSLVFFNQTRASNKNSHLILFNDRF